MNTSIDMVNETIVKSLPQVFDKHEWDSGDAEVVRARYCVVSEVSHCSILKEKWICLPCSEHGYGAFLLESLFQ
jgi:hypothetical protein